MLTGVIVNCIAIVICSLAGTFFVKGIPERFHQILTKALGLSIVFIGISGALENENVMLLIICMVVGSLMGEAINIEGGMNRLGQYVEHRLGFGPGDFSKGFVSASVLFCTGSMAIIGALNSGLMNDHDMLFAKAILDGTISVVFASTMGIGTAFSALPVLLYEGGLAVGSSLFRDFLTQDMIREMSAVGSLLIAAIGFNFLQIHTIKVANMIPAIFLPCVYYWGIGLI